jgi:hypothetical protein
VGVYLISVLLAARLGLWLAGAASGWAPDSAARPILGAVALDLSKAPGLLLAALLLANNVAARPWIAGLALVLVTYALEVLVTLVLGQTGWLFVPVGVVACRVVSAALLVLLTSVVLRKRRRAPAT